VVKEIQESEVSNFLNLYNYHNLKFMRSKVCEIRISDRSILTKNNRLEYLI